MIKFIAVSCEFRQTGAGAQGDNNDSLFITPEGTYGRKKEVARKRQMEVLSVRKNDPAKGVVNPCKVVEGGLALPLGKV